MDFLGSKLTIPVIRSIFNALDDIGWTWLGLAVSAAYAYFGLDMTSDVKPEDP